MFSECSQFHILIANSFLENNFQTHFQKLRLVWFSETKLDIYINVNINNSPLFDREFEIFQWCC